MADTLGWVPDAFWQNGNPFLSNFSGLEMASAGWGPFKVLALSQLELTGLISRRAQAYMEIPTRLSQCRTPQDLIHEQMQFCFTAFQQFAESSQRVTKAWMQLPVLMATDSSSADLPQTHDYIVFPEPETARREASKGRSRKPRAA